ncbi:MAG: hypothetical protein A2514_13760 [Gammaproteobacteria bacterium RIFOXYD12_FULL_61_37]|nr:MAG: hypothetical protein A2514_13760 [Gammaproteobacteria bacterium RIFOXYD12_FULL_61_37]
MNFTACRHRLRARLFTWLRRPGDAAEEYRQLLVSDPGSTIALNGLAFQAAARGESAEAERLFRQSLAAKPEQPAVWHNLGYMLDRQGRHEEAVTAFTEATRFAPKLDQAWYGLGHASAALGRHADAVTALEKAMALVPDNPHVLYSLGMAHHKLGDADKVTGIAEHLNRYDRRTTLQLIRDSGRTDLEHLIADYEPDFFNRKER